MDLLSFFSKQRIKTIDSESTNERRLLVNNSSEVLPVTMSASSTVIHPNPNTKLATEKSVDCQMTQMKKVFILKISSVYINVNSLMF